MKHVNSADIALAEPTTRYQPRVKRPAKPSHSGYREKLAQHLHNNTSWLTAEMIIVALIIFDFSIVVATGFGIYQLYVAPQGYSSAHWYLPLIAMVAITLPVSLALTGYYRMHRLLQPYRQLVRLCTILSILFAVLSSAVFLNKIGIYYSRVWMVSFFSLLLCLTMAARGLAFCLVRNMQQAGELTRRAVIIGGGAPAAKLISALGAHQSNDIGVVGVFDDRDDMRSPMTVNGLPKLGNFTDLEQFIRDSHIDLLIITLPFAAQKRILELSRRLWMLPVDIRLSAYGESLRLLPRAYSYLGQVPVLDLQDKPVAGWASLIKTLEDKVLATILLVVLLPVMALVALMVKIDSPGPALFRQKRYGFNNELIEVFKFRSMYVEASDFTAQRLVTKNDPRVTPIGRFIRKTSLDELPQLFNVLRGELSLVGPRPHATHASVNQQLYHSLIDTYFARTKVKPGITGWAQVNGWRGETDTTEKLERRIEHDLYYIENWSFTFDLYILLRTPFSLLETENSY